MLGRILARAMALAAGARDFFSGLATGLFVIWFFPRLATGMGAILLIGCLTMLVH